MQKKLHTCSVMYVIKHANSLKTIITSSQLQLSHLKKEVSSHSIRAKISFAKRVQVQVQLFFYSF